MKVNIVLACLLPFMLACDDSTTDTQEVYIPTEYTQEARELLDTLTAMQELGVELYPDMRVLTRTLALEMVGQAKGAPNATAGIGRTTCTLPKKCVDINEGFTICKNGCGDTWYQVVDVSDHCFIIYNNRVFACDASFNGGQELPGW